MSKGVSIQEDGSGRRISNVRRVLTDSQNGRVPWVPKPLTNQKFISKNGMYLATLDDLDGYSKIRVNVPGGIAGTDTSGNVIPNIPSTYEGSSISGMNPQTQGIDTVKIGNNGVLSSGETYPSKHRRSDNVPSSIKPYLGDDVVYTDKMDIEFCGNSLTSDSSVYFYNFTAYSNDVLFIPTITISNSPVRYRMHERDFDGQLRNVYRYWYRPYVSIYAFSFSPFTMNMSYRYDYFLYRDRIHTPLEKRMPFQYKDNSPITICTTDVTESNASAFIFNAPITLTKRRNVYAYHSRKYYDFSLEIEKKVFYASWKRAGIKYVKDDGGHGYDSMKIEYLGQFDYISKYFTNDTDSTLSNSYYYPTPEHGIRYEDLRTYDSEHNTRYRTLAEMGLYVAKVMDKWD